MADQKLDLKQLIQHSKTLTEASISKLETEQILKELIVFQKIQSFACKDGSTVSDTNPGIQNLFKVNVKCYPQDSGLESLHQENVVITLTNVSQSLSLNPNYWSMLTLIKDGGNFSNSVVWTLEKTLGPNDEEKVSILWTPKPLLNESSLVVKLLFEINAINKYFHQNIPIFSTNLDILFLLTPVRHSCSSKETLTIDKFLEPDLNLDEPSFNETTIFDQSFVATKPNINQFFIKCESLILQDFFTSVLLKDCAHRGFDSNNSSEQELQCYFQETLIQVSLKQNVKKVSVKCKNSYVLLAIKLSLLKRLFQTKNIEVKCFSDEMCEKLYGLKLKLEEFSNAHNEMSLPIAKHYLEMYLELRDISEDISFISINAVE